MWTSLGPQLLFEAAETGACWDQATDDHVLFETAQPVALAFDGCFRENPGGLLEGGRRNEAVGVE